MSTFAPFAYLKCFIFIMSFNPQVPFFLKYTYKLRYQGDVILNYEASRWRQQGLNLSYCAASQAGALEVWTAVTAGERCLRH